MTIFDLALRLSGMPGDTIAEIETSAPHFAKLLQLFKDNEPLVKEAQRLAADAKPVIARAQAFYAKLSPLIEPAMQEIDAVMPAATDVIAFIQQQQQSGEPQS